MTTGRTGSGSHHDDAQRPAAETMAFGPSGSDRPDPPAGPAREPVPAGSPDRSADEGVDTWFTEPDEPAEPEPTWLSRRWEQWTALDRERRLVAVLCGVAVVALVVALVGLVTDDPEPPVQLPAVESHGLDPDQAACFDYARIEDRLVARVSDDSLGDPDSGDLIAPLNAEVDALDSIASRYPEADYVLISAFAAVADSSAAILEIEAAFEFDAAMEARETALEGAAEACADVGDFDVDELAPTG